METKQTINFNISDPKVADKVIAYLREQKMCDDDKILRKLALMDKKLEALGAARAGREGYGSVHARRHAGCRLVHWRRRKR